MIIEDSVLFEEAVEKAIEIVSEETCLDTSNLRLDVSRDVWAQIKAFDQVYLLTVDSRLKAWVAKKMGIQGRYAKRSAREYSLLITVLEDEQAYMKVTSAKKPNGRGKFVDVLKIYYKLKAEQIERKRQQDELKGVVRHEDKVWHIEPLDTWYGRWKKIHLLVNEDDEIEFQGTIEEIKGYVELLSDSLDIVS